VTTGVESNDMPPIGDSEDVTDRTRHTSAGLLIVGLGLAAMVLSMATSSFLGAKAQGQPIDPTTMKFLSGAFIAGSIVSLVGKGKIRLDRPLFAEPQWLDYSIGAGFLAYALGISTIVLQWPDVIYVLSMTAIPVSFLLFLRFLSSLAEQYDRPDLMRRSHGLFQLSAGTLATTVLGYGLILTPAALVGVLFVFFSLLAACVAAFSYARLLAEFRRVV
jgi:hypothetical protein